METFAIGRPARRRCDGVSRRHLLRLGSAGLWGGLSGLALPGLLRAQEVRGPGSPQPRAKNVIFIFLEGGPPQQGATVAGAYANDVTASAISPTTPPTAPIRVATGR